MGDLITISTQLIRPSQDYLKEGTLRHIVGLISAKKDDLLPPPPIVRRAGESYIALDGHNMIAVHHVLSRPISVYVAKSEDDTLPGSDEATTKRNHDLSSRYERAEEMSQRSGLNSFDELIVKYPDLRKVSE